jgi:ERCC4-type nuclease
MPEQYGADYLMYVPNVGRVGVQRKEINDFIASVRDDRLRTEVALLCQLPVAMLILEGRIEFTNDGLLLATHSPFTRAQLLGTLWLLQSTGLWITSTNSTTETIECLSLFSRWVTKQKHTTLTGRNGPRSNPYGKVSDDDWQVHILQGFPGMGYERARAVRDFYGGLPLAWTGTLTDVPGIGSKTWTKLRGML